LKRPRADLRLRAARAAASPALARRLAPILNLDVPRGAGAAAALALILGSLALGVVKGGHLPQLVTALDETRHAAANAIGFRIADIAIEGAQQITREEILAGAGITGRNSLLFLDADAARARLMDNPWIAQATVLKLYPDRLRIAVREREAFALWQVNRAISVIAADGTVLEPYVPPRFSHLPFVVGRGAATRASEFLSLLDRHPPLRDRVRASVLVAERRWNLKLKNGIDVRLPESGAEAALARLVALDREKKLLTRDIAAVDLRLDDRVTVRLSEEAAQARAEALRDGKTGRKGGDV
jgi:cell division protein FtsQ